MSTAPLDMDALEKLLAEATPPPWQWVKRRARPDTIHGKRRPEEVGSDLGASHLFNVYGANGDPNGPAVVALRNTAPDLLARARAADALADALEAFMRAHAEDGCCGPGAGKKPDLPRGTTDYCEACTVGRAALHAAGRP